MKKFPLNKRTKIVACIGVLILLFTTAGSCFNDNGNAARTDKTSTGNFDAQMKNDPIPSLNDSLERANIIEHLKRNNQPDRIRYVYLLTDYGQVVAYHVAKGKITSSGAQLTPTDEVVDRTDGDVVVQAPTDDGSFGGDEGGVYFFTDTGVEIQWNGKWYVSDAPMKIKDNALVLTTK